MLSAAAMRKVRMIVLDRDQQRVAELLGKLGLMHLRKSVDEGGGQLEPEQLLEGTARCRKLAERLQRLMERLEVEVPPAPSVGQGLPASLEKIENMVGSLEAEIDKLADRFELARQALADTEDILKALAPYRDVQAPVGRLAESPLLDVRAGAAPADRLEAIRAALPDGVLLVPLGQAEPERDVPRNALFISGRRRRFAMETVLKEQGLQEGKVPAWEDKEPAAVYREAAGKKEILMGRIGDLRSMLRAIGRRRAGELTEAYGALLVQLKLYEAEQNFGATWATAVITGWVPAAKVEQLRRAVGQATEGQFTMEVAAPTPEEIEQGRVPTLVAHSPLLAPFQTMVLGYGTATYTEIEPTLMFAVSFLLMFGIVFGDLGHGLCLLGIGLLMRRLSRAPAFRDVGYVVAAAGAASALFGTFFQGSLFGKPLKEMGFALTLGFEPIRFEGPGAGAAGHVVRYLILALACGVVLISFGVALNIANRLRSGDYRGMLLGRFGVAGLAFYWGALALGARALLKGSAGAGWLVAAVIGLPLAAMTVREVADSIRHGESGGLGGALMGIFQGLIEAVETVMLYLANTFSFLRVAAFALSHAALSYTVFVFGRMVSGLPGGPLWQGAAFVVGTAGLLGLEGLIVTIQILRLEYYEFFTKFFRGEGVRYEPFRLP